METVLSKDGTTIAYERHGQGPTLIIVLGALCDRNFASTPQLVELLSRQFTVYNYDRRGKGDSSDTQPYSVEREIEDLEALINVAGGEAILYGHSSGGALALEAAAKLGSKVKKLAVYEVPYNDDPETQQQWQQYIADITELLAAGKNGDVVARFMRYTGMPAEQVEGMRHTPFWPAMEKVAPTLAYDHTFLLGLTAGIPTDMVTKVRMSALVLCGGNSFQFMKVTAQTLSQLIPQATLQVLEGQNHEVEPDALAMKLVEFLE